MNAEGTILRNQIRRIKSNGVALPLELPNSISTSMPRGLESAAGSFHSLPLHQVEPPSKPADGTVNRALTENLNHPANAPSQISHNSVKIQLSRISVRLVGFSKYVVSAMRFPSNTVGKAEIFKSTAPVMRTGDPTFQPQILPLVMGFVMNGRPISWKYIDVRIHRQTWA